MIFYESIAIKSANRRCMIKAITTDFIPPHDSKIRSIRNQVFTVEQKIAEDLDFDGRDTDAVHALIENDGIPIATGRMLPDGHIGRMAVLQPWRGKGFGRLIIDTLTAAANKKNLDSVFLGAQIQVAGFYRRLGFYTSGDPFKEVGIDHLPMKKMIKGAST